MGWLRRRRARTAAEAVVPPHRPGAWGQLAVPTRSSVRLGFADGTEVELDDASLESRELRALARDLARNLVDLPVQTSDGLADNS